jgi:large subunit ribosomal protein L17
MRHLKKKVTLDRKAGARTGMLRTLCVSLIQHGRIVTTPARARAIKTIVEPLITRGKEKNVHNMRIIEQRLSNKVAARKIVDELGPQFKTRPGGYTRMIKVAPRKGDAAEQVVLEFVSNK